MDNVTTKMDTHILTMSTNQLYFGCLLNNFLTLLFLLCIYAIDTQYILYVYAMFANFNLILVCYLATEFV